MTTIIALASCYLFYQSETNWAFFVVLSVALVQYLTKNWMNRWVSRRVDEGIDPISAAHSIPDTPTIVNMISSFVIYGFFVYALWLSLS
jgi:hypothetical protein